MARNQIRFGVLGYGSIGQRHFKNLRVLGHDVRYYDPIQSAGDWMARETLIELSHAIIVASPSNQHAKDLMDAINNGCDVFVEKPFGYDCPPLLEGFLRGARSRFSDATIATGFNLRFHSCVKEAKNKIKTLGKIKTAKFNVLQKSDKPPYLKDGIIRNWCSHELDLAMHLLGDLEVVHAIAPQDHFGKDTIEATIILNGPGVENNVYIQADYHTSPQKRFFWIEGEDGTMYVDLETRILNIDYKRQPLPYLFKGEDSWNQNYLSEMKAFINSTRGDETEEPLATGEDGVKNLYAIMKARELAGIHD